MSISPGTRFGSYEIVEPIGSGGMGEVYRARDTTLGRDIALKVLPASFSGDAMRAARFEQEAKTLASLNHANIAHIWLAYVSTRTGVPEIWVQGYPDGVAVRASSNGGYEPLWSADGRELFYRQGDAMMAVAVQPAAEFSFAPPQRLFSGPYVQRPESSARAYDVARDGRFLMILPGDQGAAAAPAAASIVVVQNFAEEIKRRVRPSGN